MMTIAAAVHQDVAAAGAVLTVGDTTVNFVNQTGWISNTGIASRRIKVLEILDATSYRVRYEALLGDGNFSKNSATGANDATYPSNLSGNDVSAYDGGTVDYPEQLRQMTQDEMDGN